MVAGHLQVKKGYYYAVLTYTTVDGKRKQPWISTGLPEKGNKKKAEKFLMELRKSYEPPIEDTGKGELSESMLFSDFMLMWLEVVRNSIEKTTFASYNMMVKKKIVPYFREKGLTLGELEAKHIQSYYMQ